MPNLRAQFSTVINVPPEEAPSSIGSDTQLNLFDGGTISKGFDARGRGDSFSKVEVNIFGGFVGSDFDAFPGATVNFFGGRGAWRFDAYRGSTVNISGGEVGRFFNARTALVNISGGSVGRGFDTLEGSTVNISGGEFGDEFHAHNGSAVIISGSEFLLNRVPINGLANIGDSPVVDDRGGAVLGVTLLDGRRRDFVLNNDSVSSSDLFETGATLQLTLSNPWLPGDTSLNDVVNEEDFRQFVQHYGTPEHSGFRTGDFNADGATSLADLILLQQNYGVAAGSPEANSAAVPEPNSFALAGMALFGLFIFRFIRAIRG